MNRYKVRVITSDGFVDRIVHADSPEEAETKAVSEHTSNTGERVDRASCVEEIKQVSSTGKTRGYRIMHAEQEGPCPSCSRSLRIGDLAFYDGVTGTLGLCSFECFADNQEKLLKPKP